MERSFDGIDAGMFADALDTMGFDGGLTGLRPLFPGTKFHGRAATFKMIVGTPGTFRVDDIALAAVLDSVDRGDVVVIDAGGSSISTWGELATIAAQAKGVAGLLADGAVRDVDIIRELRFPVLARHTTATPGKTRLKLISTNQEPVLCGGVAVRPGDFVFADDSGAVVCPKAKEEDVLAEVFKIQKREAEFKRFLQQGMSYREAARQLGLRQI